MRQSDLIGLKKKNGLCMTVLFCDAKLLLFFIISKLS